MKKNNITRRLSLRAKFKSMDQVEVVIMDEFNNVQIELIPVTLKRNDSATEEIEVVEGKEEDKDGD